MAHARLDPPRNPSAESGGRYPIFHDMHWAIADRAIGHDHPPYVIAEIGVNHDGSPNRALELVRLAARAGADAIKVQVFRSDLLMSRTSRLARYQAEAGETDPAEMLRRLELPMGAQQEVLALAHDLGLAAIATVFSLELVAPAAALADARGRGFDAWKTASPDIIHRPLLSALSRTDRPMIVSTGASAAEEVARAVGWLNPPPALLQCVSAYPTPPELAALHGIDALRAAHPALAVGYSDHTTSTDTGALAVEHGAVILEKHFTDDPCRTGPDHAASLNPDAFRQYADDARARWKSCRTRSAAGPTPAPGASKRVLEIEQDVRAVSRQSIVAKTDLSAGRPLSEADLTFKRPGTGLEPFRLEEVIGRRLAIPIEADTPLRADHLIPTRIDLGAPGRLA